MTTSETINAEVFLQAFTELGMDNLTAKAIMDDKNGREIYIIKSRMTRLNLMQDALRASTKVLAEEMASIRKKKRKVGRPRNGTALAYAAE